MEHLIKLYFGFWAQIAQWHIISRAALIIGILFLIVHLLFMPILIRICRWILRILDVIIKGIYLVITACAEVLLARKGVEKRASVLNIFSTLGEKISTRLESLIQKMSSKKRIVFWKMALLYAIVICFIALPDFLNGKMDDSYLSIFSGVRNYYCSLEQKALEKAKDYPPLFVTQARNAHSADAALATTAPESSDEQENIILLSLSKKGRDGANIREKASAKSKIITTVSGKATLVYLKQEGNWVLVETEDGKTGWIKFDLVDGIPE